MPTPPRLDIRSAHSAVLSRRPDGQAERDLVHKIREVVNQVQGVVVNTLHQIAEEVAQRVDGPASGHNEAHCVVGRLYMLVHLVTACGHRASLAEEYLEEDEDGTHEQFPKHHAADVWLHRGEDQ